MIKKEIVEEIAEQTGLNKSIVREITDKFLITLYNAIKEGRRVELRGFGVFEVRNLKGRKGRNPKTGEEVSIPPRDKVVFKITKLYEKEREGRGEKNEMG